MYYLMVIEEQEVQIPDIKLEILETTQLLSILRIINFVLWVSSTSAIAT